MPVTRANGIDIAWEETGPADGPVILLVMGLAMPLALWPEEFVRGLAREGFRVITFDNRDVGRSQRIAGEPPGHAFWAVGKALMGLPVKGVYTVEDMADDAAGLLEALGIDRAHVAGMSMGGMIAQEVAARHPQRTLSLTSIMSTSGNPRASIGHPRALQAILKLPPDPQDTEAVAQHLAFVLGVIGSRTHPTPKAELVEIGRRVAQRGTDPQGANRQLFAILASGDRRADLKRVTAPTLVLHGAEDPLLPPSGGRDTAASIPGAVFEEVAGMGHDLPGPLLPQLVARIAAHCRAAQPVPPSAAPVTESTPLPDAAPSGKAGLLAPSCGTPTGVSAPPA